MKYKNKKNSRRCNSKNLSVFMILCLILSFYTIQAQETISATGGNSFGSGGSASYTVGQVFYQTYSGTNGLVAEGVQQAYDILEVSAIKESKGINNLSLLVYPNPVTDYITLSINQFEISNLLYQLYDMNGKIIQNEKITENDTRIVMINLAPATYFLKVTEVNKEVKIFKIIKN